MQVSGLREFPALNSSVSESTCERDCFHVRFAWSRYVERAVSEVSSCVRGEQNEPEEEALLQAGLELQYSE